MLKFCIDDMILTFNIKMFSNPNSTKRFCSRVTVPIDCPVFAEVVWEVIILVVCHIHQAESFQLNVVSPAQLISSNLASLACLFYFSEQHVHLYTVFLWAQQIASSSFRLLKFLYRALYFSPAFRLFSVTVYSVHRTLTWSWNRNSTFCRQCALFLYHVSLMSLTVLLVQFFVFFVVGASISSEQLLENILLFFFGTRTLFIFAAQFNSCVLAHL